MPSYVSVIEKMVVDGQLGFSPPPATLEAETMRRLAVVYDLDLLRARFEASKSAFPEWWQHTLAAKAAPIPFVLREAVKAGLGIECASHEECRLATEIGCPPALIVFDSPCKTRKELEWALNMGICINLDNFGEVACVGDILGGEAGTTKSRVGLRVNPLVGEGGVGEMSVSTTRSKFGVPLSSENQITEAFGEYDWLTGLHVHVGSMCFSHDYMVDGIARVWELAQRLKITTFNIGGGLLPQEHDPRDPRHSDARDFEGFSDCLRNRIPQLFQANGMRVITEFGKAYLTWTAFVVSVVQSVKSCDSPDVDVNVICHCGADLFMRTCYAPHTQSRHPIALLDAQGRPVTRPLLRCDVGGPLCFEGDKVARGVELSTPQAGDLIVFHGAGANTLALWSRHCSRPVPPVWAFESGVVHLQSGLHDQSPGGGRHMYHPHPLCGHLQHRKGTTVALMLVDFQSEWHAAVKQHFPSLANNVSQLLERCRYRDIVVVHILAKYSESPGWHARFRDNDLRVQPCQSSEPFAAPIGGEAVFYKPSFNAFDGTLLHSYLTSIGVETILLTGLLTSVCVQMTAYGGFARGYGVHVITDCCGDITSDAHDAGLRQMNAVTAQVIDSFKAEKITSQVHFKRSVSLIAPLLI